MEMESGFLGDHPLQDAGVFPAGGDHVTVVVQEGNVGHVTAVATVLVARSLEMVKEWSDSHQGRIKKLFEGFHLKKKNSKMTF